ncbi:hypothetical protein Cni_G25114 [Canna indica]|uniref:WRKY domain-containing protein n=1 Tax=Canna indica TaxID=4628 RepID=A0AAQ3KZI3_9LILI|nr:hypothetical protein Cni_G25114 [Canna indica]
MYSPLPVERAALVGFWFSGRSVTLSRSETFIGLCAYVPTGHVFIPSYGQATNSKPVHTFKAMDDILRHVFDACNLSRELEATIHMSVDLAADAHYLLGSCKEIVGAFSKVTDELSSIQRLSYCNSQMHLVDTGAGAGDSFHACGPLQMVSETEPPVAEFSGGSTCTNAANTAPSVRKLEGPSVQKSLRKRKEGTIVKRVLSLPNMESPPDDGYAWKKYGQKEILNSKFPRSYYHCSHKYHYGCEAKKQVQRLDDDPWTLEVSYRGTHTCQSSLAPYLIHNQLVSNATINNKNDNNNSNGNPQGVPMMQETMQLITSKPASIQHHNWLEMDPQNRDCSIRQEQMQGDRDVDCPVAELADAMFSPWSSGISMDVIFSPKKENDQEL